MAEVLTTHSSWCYTRGADREPGTGLSRRTPPDCCGSPVRRQQSWRASLFAARLGECSPKRMKARREAGPKGSTAEAKGMGNTPPTTGAPSSVRS
jgi:hypothetical protein